MDKKNTIRESITKDTNDKKVENKTNIAKDFCNIVGVAMSYIFLITFTIIGLKLAFEEIDYSYAIGSLMLLAFIGLFATAIFFACRKEQEPREVIILNSSDKKNPHSHQTLYS